MKFRPPKVLLAGKSLLAVAHVPVPNCTTSSLLPLGVAPPAQLSVDVQLLTAVELPFQVKTPLVVSCKVTVPVAAANR